MIQYIAIKQAVASIQILKSDFELSGMLRPLFRTLMSLKVLVKSYPSLSL